MAVHSRFLGPVTITGDDAKAFTRRMSRTRVNRAATATAQSGRKLAANFVKHGSVTIKLKPVRESSKGRD
ncbi:MAG: hypothetical protein LBE22_01115 [Azoarcus sp.]|jgi:hypothetical protein|nr:hypothetical protein [Azoarcus sp.]